MNGKVRNNITNWLLDRVAQGEHEESGSMDWAEFTIDGEKIRVTIMKDEDEETGEENFIVTMGDSFAPDFSLTRNVTEEVIKWTLDLWYDAVMVEA
jgi:hypothetical protein